MPIAWNEDDPRDLPVIQKNLSSVLLQITQEAFRRQPPTVAAAQEENASMLEKRIRSPR